MLNSDDVFADEAVLAQLSATPRRPGPRRCTGIWSSSIRSTSTGCEGCGRRVGDDATGWSPPHPTLYVPPRSTGASGAIAPTSPSRRTTTSCCGCSTRADPPGSPTCRGPWSGCAPVAAALAGSQPPGRLPRGSAQPARGRRPTPGVDQCCSGCCASSANSAGAGPRSVSLWIGGSQWNGGAGSGRRWLGKAHGRGRFDDARSRGLPPPPPLPLRRVPPTRSGSAAQRRIRRGPTVPRRGGHDRSGRPGPRPSAAQCVGRPAALAGRSAPADRSSTPGRRRLPGRLHVSVELGRESARAGIGCAGAALDHRVAPARTRLAPAVPARLLPAGRRVAALRPPGSRHRGGDGLSGRADDGGLQQRVSPGPRTGSGSGSSARPAPARPPRTPPGCPPPEPSWWAR